MDTIGRKERAVSIFLYLSGIEEINKDIFPIYPNVKIEKGITVELKWL